MDRSIYEEDTFAVIPQIEKGHAIWSIPYGIEGARNLGNASDYANNFAHVDKRMRVDRTLWCHINIDGHDIGWVDFQAIPNQAAEQSGEYHVTTNDTSHSVWSKPYGVKNASWIDSAVAYKNKKLESKMSIYMGKTRWLAFDNGRGGVFWLDSDVVSEGKVN
ncbi:GW domain-containing glycosaminoglycan-binding protein [Bacillus sp. NPDC077411]|uniref:GW domain-containing glycosaminoglycan-binding protein n=1 Tax=Bacillus sp. NPDC077411 TaxID=3363947 RepID=UPI0037C8F8B1